MIDVYVVEDMAIARASLVSMLNNNGFNVVGSAAKAERAWTDFNSMELDLILVDIHLAGDKDGIWLVNQIRKISHLPVIYLTAYGDSATQESVINTKPDGFLLKPYNEVSLLTNIKIAVENYNSRVRNEELDEPILVKTSKGMVKVYPQEIKYLKSDGNYVHFYLEENHHLIRSKLVDMAKNLPSYFVQTHQRFVVNAKKVTYLATKSVRIAEEEIPVSRSYREMLADKFSQ